MEYLRGIMQNRVLLTALSGWAVAQVLKTIIYWIINRDFKLERMVGSGGMPSSHAATTCAMCVAVAREFGTASFPFAITAIVTIVVLYDARGVRFETGKQAITITAILDHLLQEGTILDMPQLELKELVGHTPLQVLVGSVIGVLVGLLVR